MTECQGFESTYIHLRKLFRNVTFELDLIESKEVTFWIAKHMVIQFVAPLVFVFLTDFVNWQISETLVVSHQRQANMKSGTIEGGHAWEIRWDDYLLVLNKSGTFTSLLNE